MKFYVTFSVLIFIVVVAMGCKKEVSPASNTEKEGVLYFRGFDETQIIFYVGGEERSSENIDFSKLLDEVRQSWISEAYYQNNTYFFDGDTLEIDVGEGPISRYAYHFSNDSLFSITQEFMTGQYYHQYLGMGSETEIRNKQGLVYMRIVQPSGYMKKGAGFEPSQYNTAESVIGRHGFQGVDLMGENDTILLLNQRKLYN